METTTYLQTGQVTCHDASGRAINCAKSGQDGEFARGMAWPKPRFVTEKHTITDRLTGLIWSRDANLAEFPLMWQEALDYVQQMNHQQQFGYHDWRVPNRHELRSLISHQTKHPALPTDPTFNNVFNGWYWSSTTSVINPAHAWYVNIDGGRMFYGGKDQSFMLWPVRGQDKGIIPKTGQQRCYDSDGLIINCAGTGQDAEFSYGYSWPSPRFETTQNIVIDRLTGLSWQRCADLTGPVSWSQAEIAIEKLNTESNDYTNHWRLPNINELESLIDCNSDTPALTNGHPFMSLHDVYWSSTTSLYEPDWAWALYLDKGAIGVGQKSQAEFYVWSVRN
ncbi:MAG: DUF1566 domain-containing protein [Gammaproteobacteria bacterium]